MNISLRGEEVKRIISIIFITVVVSFSIVTTNATENITESSNENTTENREVDDNKNEESGVIYDFSPIYNSLSDDVKKSLENIGVSTVNTDELSSITFSSVINEIANIASKNISSPLKGLISVTALLLLCSMLSAYKNTLSCEVSTALNISSTLCITCAVALPATEVIKNTAEIINVASNLMIAYLPIMVVIMASSGHPIRGASYYTMMLTAGEGMSQLSSKVIVPMLNMFLGLSLTSSVSPDINLSGFIGIISKTLKWLFGFGMKIFTSILAIKQLITSSADDVSASAVRFTLNSFIPVVGSALSDAYKTVQGSIGLLKSGVGVFVIISVAVVFLPVILQSLMWILTLWLGKSTAEILGLSQPTKLLESVTTVFSTLLSILLCIMSIYIISTAIVLIAGRS